MANSPAARSRRKQARKNYLSDSSFDGSSSTSSTHSSCENVSLSHRKKRINRARACALAARKVSIDNDPVVFIIFAGNSIPKSEKREEKEMDHGLTTPPFPSLSFSLVKIALFP